MEITAFVEESRYRAAIGINISTEATAVWEIKHDGTQSTDANVLDIMFPLTTGLVERLDCLDTYESELLEALKRNIYSAVETTRPSHCFVTVERHLAASDEDWASYRKFVEM
jgi:hypothetical protein